MKTSLAHPAKPENTTGDLLASLLEEQRSFTAVEEFARWHDHVEEKPSQARYYERLLPAEPLATDEQFAFEVDLDACSGCKACVTACHNLNGLEPEETWRSVGLLTSTSAELPIIQPVTTACHHCLNPGCLEGCPVQAYEKSSTTGIVHHLDDQCIGCQYCVLMCPYEVPQYSVTKGIVRKCDMCRSRLARNEAPACVQSCPNAAIRITKVKRADVYARSARGEFLADSPDPGVTHPTTRYLSSVAREPALCAVDAQNDHPAHGHEPLAFMLVLTQWSVGLLVCERFFASSSSSTVLLVLSALLGTLGGAAATLHLGRPFGAWRAWLGWRTSWLSREIIAFGIYGFTGGNAAFLAIISPASALVPIFAWLAFVSGAAGVFCSIMIYVATRRSVWSFPRTAAKFALTAARTSAATFASISFTLGERPAREIFLAVIVCTLLKLAIEAEAFYGRDPYVLRMGKLLKSAFRRESLVRLSLAIACGIAVPTLLAFVPMSLSLAAAIAWPSLLGTVAGEIIERSLFFRAAVAPRMPGGVPT